MSVNGNYINRTSSRINLPIEIGTKLQHVPSEAADCCGQENTARYVQFTFQAQCRVVWDSVLLNNFDVVARKNTVR
jgi:hypothetical protein